MFIVNLLEKLARHPKVNKVSIQQCGMHSWIGYLGEYVNINAQLADKSQLSFSGIDLDDAIIAFASSKHWRKLEKEL